MPSRRWMWIRPTPHIYAYNREISSFGGSSASSASATSATESTRNVRATSEAAFERSASTARAARASSLAPEPGTSLAGYTGFYGRRLALLKELEESKRQEARSSAAAASASAKSVSASMKSTSVQKSVETQQTVMEKRSMEERKMSLRQEQERSIKEGRSSMSRAVRRAEYHAETSAKDPRHVGVPRDLSDDICKKVADIHMCPYDSREVTAARQAMAQGKLKIEKMEKELDSITASAMKYKSMYLKSASQMAKEAMEAAESEAMASKKIKRTVVEESSRRQVAAA